MNKYKIYKITNSEHPNKAYYGITSKNPKTTACVYRVNNRKYRKNPETVKFNTVFDIIEPYDNVNIEVLQEIEGELKDAKLICKEYKLNDENLINKVVGGRTSKDYYQMHKEENKERSKEYYRTHLEDKKAKSRAYYRKKKQERLEAEYQLLTKKNEEI